MSDPTADEGRQLDQLLAGADAALGQLDPDGLLQQLTVRLRQVLAVDTCAVLLMSASGRELVATAASGLEEEVRMGLRIPVGTGFAGTIAASAQPLILDRIDPTTVVNQTLIEERLTVLAGVPLIASDRVLGVLHVGSRTPRRFTAREMRLLSRVAERAALAAQARMHRLARATTLALQQSLLPAQPPKVDGLDVAARYIPGAEVGVGGDWYDLLDLPDGQVGVVIGDVAGNGLHAAVVMGRIRSALRAYALETSDPADVLTRLDRKIQRFEPGAMATVAYVVIDIPRRTVTLSLAGHPPPILFDARTGPSTWRTEPDLPLGTFPDPPRTTSTRPMPEALLLYTDGLVERRGTTIIQGIDALLRELRGGTAEQLCAQATALLHHAPATDDVALIAVRPEPGKAPPA